MKEREIHTMSAVGKRTLDSSATYQCMSCREPGSCRKSQTRATLNKCMGSLATMSPQLLRLSFVHRFLLMHTSRKAHEVLVTGGQQHRPTPLGKSELCIPYYVAATVMKEQSPSTGHIGPEQIVRRDDSGRKTLQDAALSDPWRLGRRIRLPIPKIRG
jgi:hypothetical protein